MTKTRKALASRRLFLAAGPAAAVFGSLHAAAAAAEADPWTVLLHQFRVAQAEYRRAVDAAADAEKRFQTIEPEIPRWTRGRNYGPPLRMTVRGKNIEVLDWTQTGIERLRDLLDMHMGAVRDRSNIGSVSVVRACRRDLGEIAKYRAEYERVRHECGAAAASAQADAKAAIVYKLADRIVEPEPTSVAHMAAQAEVLWEGYDDCREGERSFYARVMKVLGARRELTAA